MGYGIEDCLLYRKVEIICDAGVDSHEVDEVSDCIADEPAVRAVNWHYIEPFAIEFSTDAGAEFDMISWAVTWHRRLLRVECEGYILESYRFL